MATTSPIFELDLAAADRTALEAAARAYAQDGCLELTGVGRLADALEAAVAEALGGRPGRLAALLDPAGQAEPLAREDRQRLSKIATSPVVARELLEFLGELLGRLLGPLVHTSSTYHTQVKGGATVAAVVDHGGYPEQSDFMELHGQYLLHQDFTGANLPTTPSGLTVWVGLNDCPDWTLRLYPGTHRLGMVIDRWLRSEDARLAGLAAPIDLPARRGSAVVFNSMLIHGTSRPGPLRRLSCDVRFFPLCGFLPTQPRWLGESHWNVGVPQQAAEWPALAAPRLEAQVLLGRRPALPAAVDEGSPLLWAWYLLALRGGDMLRASQHFARLIHRTRASGTVETFSRRFFGRPLEREALDEVCRQFGAAGNGHARRAPPA